MSEYTEAALAWSFIGLIVGFFLGIIFAKMFLVRSRTSSTGGIMTTPERLRRRQYIEGIGLGFLGVMVLVSTVIDARRDNAQDACILEQVTSLTASLEVRSDLTAKDATSVRTLIGGLLAAEDDQAKSEAAVDEYIDTQREIGKIRAENPFPPFPDGKCR